MDFMPRQARIVLPGLPHHVTHRGNNRQAVFLDEHDRWFYLRQLRRLSRRHGVEVLAWCLMTNHVHLVLVPSHAEGLARVVGQSHWLHAQAFNKRHERTGHLWHGRYFSTPMDEFHTIRCMLYVERNPVRAGIVDRSEDHPWSSARARVEGRDAFGLIDPLAWSQRYESDAWSAMLREGEPASIIERIEVCSKAGVPLMSDENLAELEQELGRSLKPRTRGRPRSRS